MPERKSWTEEEDKVLKYLYEQVKLKKWSKIARTMAEEYKMPGRNGKQCRERYHNHLDSSIVKEDWSRQEELNLYEFHNEIGNKWAVIALKMPGRTDNCVKNHFYSKLRKALRKLNKAIHDSFRRQFRQIRMTVLYKILEATDDKFKDKPTISTQITHLSAQLKNKLLHLSHDNQNVYQGDLKRIRELILQIHQFSHNYKRKPKKCRRGANQSSDLMRLPKIDRFKCSSDIDEEEEDENQSQNEDIIPVSHEESYQIGGSNHTPKQDVKQFCNSLGGKSSLCQPIQIISPSVQEQNLYLSNSLNVENILKQAGVLQDVNMLSMSTFLKKSLSLRSDQSQNREKSQGFNLGDSFEYINFGIPKNGDVSIDQHQLFQSN